MQTFANVTLKETLAMNTWPHSVNPYLSQALGTYEAVIVEYLHKWIAYKAKNRAKFKDTFKERKMWVYKTLAEWSEEFPYITERQIRRVLDRLRKMGVILVGNFNRFKANRCLWYTINYQYRMKILEPFGHRGQMDMATGGKSHLATGGKSRHVIHHSLTNMEEPEKTDSSLPYPHDGDLMKDQVEVKREYQKKMHAKLSKRLAAKATVGAAIEFWKLILGMYGVTKHVSLTKKETGMMKQLCNHLQTLNIPINEFLEYCVGNWKDLRKEMVWHDNKKKSRLGPQPFFQEIVFAKEDLIISWERNHAGVDSETGDMKTSEFVTVTTEEDVPADYPSRDKVLTQIRVFGHAEIRRD